MSENCKLSQAVQESLDDYFMHLEGEPPHAVYDMVLGCVEKPLLNYIMHKVGGNQSKAAEILDINRNTLRKKLQQYKIE
ncbi:helix-turn-helix domain-containing protein [Methylotenera mobilis]|uniref:Putative Fis-like DNA-binding protein n=1 Tax=Methylotenera mobilis (strain JLW8 / ATCC BAA-1282 / DSM 17540) TaxID=583345 RepID=C6WTJ2_METML|nr:helix-turn-helix domain-containing protein [Methylotenera mobilis]ACT47314.1 transcriptional regulator, Fis family [Methylotenera mobilis JLW8]